MVDTSCRRAEGVALGGRPEGRRLDVAGSVTRTRSTLRCTTLRSTKVEEGCRSHETAGPASSASFGDRAVSSIAHLHVGKVTVHEAGNSRRSSATRVVIGHGHFAETPGSIHVVACVRVLIGKSEVAGMRSTDALSIDATLWSEGSIRCEELVTGRFQLGAVRVRWPTLLNQVVMRGGIIMGGGRRFVDSTGVAGRVLAEDSRGFFGLAAGSGVVMVSNSCNKALGRVTVTRNGLGPVGVI